MGKDQGRAKLHFGVEFFLFENCWLFSFKLLSKYNGLILKYVQLRSLSVLIRLNY